MSEQGLHSGQGPMRPFVDRTVTTPQRTLVNTGGHRFDRGEPKQIHRPGRGIRLSEASAQPTFELPTHPVGDVDRGQHAGVPPAPYGLFAPIGLGDEFEAGAGQAVIGQFGDELLDDTAGAESDRIDPVQRWLEFYAHLELELRTPGRDRPGIDPTGLPVRPCSRWPESLLHIPGRQCRECPQGADAQSPEQVDQIWFIDGFDGQLRQEFPGLSRRDDAAPPGCLLSRERAVSDSDQYLVAVSGDGA
jgi:hypothetical protein